MVRYRDGGRRRSMVAKQAGTRARLYHSIADSTSETISITRESSRCVVPLKAKTATCGCVRVRSRSSGWNAEWLAGRARTDREAGPLIGSEKRPDAVVYRRGISH